jgi:hypothetical protein
MPRLSSAAALRVKSPCPFDSHATSSDRQAENTTSRMESGPRDAPARAKPIARRKFSCFSSSASSASMKRGVSLPAAPVSMPPTAKRGRAGKAVVEKARHTDAGWDPGEEIRDVVVDQRCLR